MDSETRGDGEGDFVRLGEVAGWAGSEGARTGIRKLYLATILTFHPLLLYTTLIFSIRACLIFAEQFHNNFACHNI